MYIRRFKYKPDDVDCRLCTEFRKRKCTLEGCPWIAERIEAGVVSYGYRLYNLYWYVDGNKKTPHALVCTVVQDLNKAEGYVFKNIENVTIGRGLPGANAGMSSSVNGDTYTVAQLYDAVKRIDRNEGGLKYSDADRNYLFSYTERDDGVAYLPGKKASYQPSGFFPDPQLPGLHRTPCRTGIETGNPCQACGLLRILSVPKIQKGDGCFHQYLYQICPG